MTTLLLNMKAYTVVKEFATQDEAQAALDSPEFADFPKHLVEREDWDLPTVDLVKFYNGLTGESVKRFADRKTGMARLLAALNGEVAKIEDTKKDGNEMATKATKKTPAKKAAKKAPSTRSAIDRDQVLKPTKAGLERHWHEGANRGKLFTYLKGKGEATVGAMIAYGKAHLDMEEADVVAAIRKLLDPKAANGASAK